MAQPEPASEPAKVPAQPLSPPTKHGFLRKLFGRSNEIPQQPSAPPPPDRDGDVDASSSKPTSINRLSRRVVAGLPRAQTFKRQQSEQRVRLAPVETTQLERRTASVDRRSRGPQRRAVSQVYGNPRVSAPSFIRTSQHDPLPPHGHKLGFKPAGVPLQETQQGADNTGLDDGQIEGDEILDEYPPHDAQPAADARSVTTSQYESQLQQELEYTWILNLSMHFRDRSKREKFFITYRESKHLWRRVTISLDYRNAPPNSLESDLVHTELQREKSAKIYEAIRESLPEIQFYDTVTNLKLQTTDGRLHVHVVEDGNEIISYPPVSQIQYLGCRRIRERDINFEAHMSGFVYRVNIGGRILIKKEIPSPETIDEFLYEVNALHSLRFSDNVVRFYGVVVDDDDERVKGLLISFAEQGALVDLIYDHCKDSNRGLPWSYREQWARQIVQGLADIHESGFVQGDFTLSNIVIDGENNAKIIDINRRGCPVGWEPPEAAALIDSSQRIAMYIGVKSDLFQLGMVLWGLAMEEDEPERQGRPLILGPEVGVPDWYRQITEICLSYDPRMRLQASALIHKFPPETDNHIKRHDSKLEHASISVDDGYSLRNYLVDGYHADGHPQIKTVGPPSEWSEDQHRYPSPSPYEPYYHTRGRSPPSPLPSNFDRSESPRSYQGGRTTWAANINIAPSYSDVGADELPPYGYSRQPTPTPTFEKMPLNYVGPPDGQHPLGQHPLAPQEATEPTGTTDPDQWDMETPKGEAVLEVVPEVVPRSVPPEDAEAATIQTHRADAERDAVTEAAASSESFERSSKSAEGAALDETKDTPETPPTTSGPDIAAVCQFLEDAKKEGALVESSGNTEGFYTSHSTKYEGSTAPQSPEVATQATMQTTESGNFGKDMTSISAASTELDLPINTTGDTSIPRTVDVPGSLAGIGSGHVVDEDEKVRVGDVIQDKDLMVETPAHTEMTESKV